MHDFPFLSLAIWAPILFGACLLRAGSDQHLQRTRLIALIGAIAGLGLFGWVGDSVHTSSSSGLRVAALVTFLPLLPALFLLIRLPESRAMELT